MSTSPGVPLHPEALTPGTRVGRWRVVERLGVGGQGVVYRVEDLDHPGEFYALKLALHARDGRAEREQSLLMAQAVHPHVVRFHGCARWPHPREGLLGFVMDWAPGRALDVWAEEAHTTFRQFALASATVADTVGELHARGVFHRDLKPEHIHIRASDDQPVLLDFGALGVCLYRATTGRYPFSEWLSVDVLLWAIANVPPQEPVLVNPRVPRALNDIIVRLLAKDPRERYPSGAALRAALLEAARGTEAAWDTSVFVPSTPRVVLPPRTPSPRQPPTPPGPEARWRRWSVGLGLFATVLLMLLPRVPPSGCGAPVPFSRLPTQGRAETVPAQGGSSPRPAPQQKRAPCKSPLEVEVSGACWHSLEQRPPKCPPETVAHEGKCLWPVPRPAPTVPTSVQGGAPDAP